VQQQTSTPCKRLLAKVEAAIRRRSEEIPSITEGVARDDEHSRSPIDLKKAQRRRFAMNRRRTLMLAIAGVAGIASPSTWVGAGTEGGRRKLAAASDEASDTRGTRAEVTTKFQNLKTVGPELQVVSIQHHQDAYSVTTADGRNEDYWEANLRFKIDSSDTGPLVGKPIILAAGSAGDRASVFFASPAEISALIKH
jgi:hypothetical protein